MGSAPVPKFWNEFIFLVKFMRLSQLMLHSTKISVGIGKEVFDTKLIFGEDNSGCRTVFFKNRIT